MTALLYAIQVLQAVPSLIAAGHDVASFVNDHTAKLNAMHAENRVPTPEEWAALNAKTDELRAQLHG